MTDAIVYGSGEGDVTGPLRILMQAPDHPIGFTEVEIPPNFPGPVRHRHTETYDIFFILDGTLDIEVEGEEQSLDRGTFVMIPPGVVHTFSNRGSTPTRFLDIYHPAGLEQYVKEVAKMMAEGQTPTPEEMRSLASQYDFEPVEE